MNCRQGPFDQLRTGSGELSNKYTDHGGTESRSFFDSQCLRDSRAFMNSFVSFVVKVLYE